MVFYYSPAKGRVVAVTAWSYFLEIIVILPAVVLLMGLFEAWIPKHLIQRYLGKQSGATGILLALLFGTAPTGPLYIAFPIAAGLLKKGARPANVVIFLGAWAAAKLPQIMVEAKFLGIHFALLRLVLTVAVIAASGYIMESLAGIGILVFGKGSKEREVVFQCTTVLEDLTANWKELAAKDIPDVKTVSEDKFYEAVEAAKKELNRAGCFPRMT